MAVFMAEAFETNDVTYIAHALGVVARVTAVGEAGRRHCHSPPRRQQGDDGR